MVPTLIGMPGLWEWIVIGLVVMLLFGAKRIPEIARSMGSGVTEFKKGLRGEDDEPGKLPPPDNQPSGS